MAKSVVVKGESLDCLVMEYSDKLKRPAVILNCKDGEPFAVATVNLPDQMCPEGHSFFRNTEECEGIMDELIEQNVISEPIFMVKTGYIMVYCCKILIQGENGKDYSQCDDLDDVESWIKSVESI